MREKSACHPDYLFLNISIILVILGIIILAGVSATISQEKFGSSSYFLIHQIIYGLIPGIILSFLAYKVSLVFIKKWSLVLLLINLFFLGLVFLPVIGSHSGGASRWVDLGIISFQPSEFLKISFIIYLSAWLSNFNIEIKNQKKKFNQLNKKVIIGEIKETLIPFVIIISLIALFLILQPDISTLSLIILTAIFMYFSTGTPVWHTFFMFLSGIGTLLVLIKTAPYRVNRVLVLLKPEIDPMGLSYQIKQALIAVGSGGLFGLGLGMSRQKFGFNFGFLPQSISDSIFAIFAEETGFMGSLVIILLFLFFSWQGFKILKQTQDKFSKLLILGICSWISIQAMLNIGSMIRIIPLTGIPLPFISYGGSHIIAELIGVGIILNISKKHK